MDHLTDEQLYGLVGAEEPTGTSATAALRRRHWSRVNAFAHTVVDDPAAARYLTDLAFDQLVRGQPSTVSPVRPPRLLLLLTVSRTAARLPHGPRDHGVRGRGAARVGPPRAAEPVPTGGPVSDQLLARGFAALPPRTQALLWHSVVEREPDDSVASLTGDRPEAVAGLVSRALESCHDATLHLHLESRPTPGCSGFGRMLDAATTREDVRRHPQLTQHLGECPDCAAVLRGLVALREAPRPVLAGAVLGGAPGAAYTTGAVPDPDDDTLTLPRIVQSSPRGPAVRARDSALRQPAAAYAVGILTVLLTAAALMAVAWSAEDPPAAGVRAAPETHPGPVGSPSRKGPPAGTSPPAHTSASPVGPPSPTGSPSASATAGTSPSSSAEPTPGTTPAEVVPFRASSFVSAVNSGTGMCLDVRGGTFANGVDVITTKCRDGATTQQWRLDDDGLLRNGAQSDYCLDSRGHNGQSVGIWSCSAHKGEHGENLEFSLDTTGRIKPGTAPGLAVTPEGAAGAGVKLLPTDGSADQRWTESAG
ncbi:RICIN domain-containing protein [Streptomyces ficellus]|uniref:Ricin B lectin domain-containing protein n=1 Tax=Streptomyces ficellus TaxID=1977088 RepID=A0A6I6F314_9ACTN|nr:ricin-type beta-trefoil lectin domain protein [Streptomyces ficellus]QGV77004.1 hypothetical protein EIZ62_01100 [Streptomyces ficellus]